MTLALGHFSNLFTNIYRPNEHECTPHVSKKTQTRGIFRFYSCQCFNLLAFL